MNIFKAIELIKEYSKCSKELTKQINTCLVVIKKNEEISEEKMITIGYAIFINVLNANKKIIKENYSIEQFNKYNSAIKIIQNYLDGIKIVNRLTMKG